MTKSDYAKALVIGSYITYLMSLMDKEQQIKLTTIRLRDKILKVIRKPKYEGLNIIADDGWKIVLDQYKDERILISPAIVVETLYFNFIDIMNELYGHEVGNLVCRYVEKQSVGNINDYTKDSYRVADSLRDSVRKLIFEWSKK